MTIDISLLGPGRHVCPKCGGGDTKEHCLSIQYSDSNTAFAWRCFRAKCGFSGGNFKTPKLSKAKEPRHYTRPYKALNDDQNAIIADRFDLPDGVVDGYSAYDDRFILGVTGPQHQLRGHIAYSLSGGTPKALNYVAKTDEPFNHWARAKSIKPGAIVVVEDWFSAEKVREAGATGVALIGTLMNQSMVTDISHVARNWEIPTYVALDRDAFGKALSYKGRYAEQFKFGLQVWALDRDLKYVDVGRIRDAIENREFNFSRGN